MGAQSDWEVGAQSDGDYTKTGSTKWGKKNLQFTKTGSAVRLGVHQDWKCSQTRSAVRLGVHQDWKRSQTGIRSSFFILVH